MSRLKLESLTIKNYRSLKNVSVEKLGRLNLITGHNNVGKTSLLEAVRLWASQTDIGALLDIIDARDESAIPDRGLNASHEDDSSLLGCLCLFSGYPSLESVSVPIEISGGQRTLRISVPDRDSDHSFLSSPVKSLDGLPAPRSLELNIDNPEHTELIGLPSYYSTHLFNHITGRSRELDSSKTPCVFLSSITMNSIGSYSASSLWDNIALTYKEESVLQGLRIVEPHIKGVGFIHGGEQKDRVPVVRLSGVDRPIPLHGLGDGVTRLFEIMLALVNAEGGFLLIDEFENGLHYSIQKTAWETVLELSESLNVQVFATTHSNDCVSAFQQVADDTEDENTMILTRLLSEDGEVRSETILREKLSRRLELGREVR